MRGHRHKRDVRVQQYKLPGWVLRRKHVQGAGFWDVRHEWRIMCGLRGLYPTRRLVRCAGRVRVCGNWGTVP